MPIEIPELNLAALMPVIIIIVTGLAILMIDLFVSDKRILGWLALAGVVLAGIVGAIQQHTLTNLAFQTVTISDSYTHFFNLVFLVTAALSILVALGYLGRIGLQNAEYFSFLLFATSGMMLMAAATDLMIVFMGLEIMSITLYIMSALHRYRRTSGEAGIKYFLLGAYATGFFLYGVALIYGATGSTNLEAIATVFADGAKNPIALLGLAMLLIGFAFKVAAVPFHWWTPDVYCGAPTSVTTFMSVGAKAAGFAALLRILMVAFSPTFTVDWQIAAAILAVLTMTLGNMAALAQKDVKRMLAYSSIAHAGYILVGVAAGNADGVSGALFYLMVYAFMNVGAFAVIGVLESKNEVSTALSDYAGLFGRSPWLAGVMAVFLLSLTGFPPLAGFWGKVYIFTAAVEANLTWLVVIAVINSGIAGFYYLGVIVQMFFNHATDDAPAVNLNHATNIALGLAAIATVIFGFFPSLIVNLAGINFFG